MPPLNAVRAFEAAARADGFQAARVELHVSANAVGRPVKVLEDWLGVPLFKRLARGVALTAAAAGQGVALGSSPYIGDDLAAGRLVEPLGDLSVRSPNSFFIV